MGHWLNDSRQGGPGLVRVSKKGRSVDVNIAQYLIGGGLIAVVIAAIVWALRVSDGARGAEGGWKLKAHAAEDKVQRWESVIGAFPGVALVWEAETPDQIEDKWGAPRIYGSPLALGSLLRFSDAAVADTAAVRILQGLAAFKGADATGADAYLAPALTKLRREGAAFSLTIPTVQGMYVEADGRTAGARAVLWLLDPSVKGVEEAGGKGRLDEARSLIARDPSAFLDMLSRAPFLAFRLNAGLKLDWANAAYLETLDAKSLEAAITRNLMLDAGLAEQGRRALAAGEDITELRRLPVRGALRTFKITVFPLAGGVGGVVFDVTEQEAVAERLAQLEQAHDETLDTLSEGVAIFNADRKMTFFNRAFVQISGLDPAFLAGHPSHAAWLDALKEKRRLPAHANYPDWRASELAVYQDTSEIPVATWPLPDGRTLRLTRKRRPDGGLLVVFTDMTEQSALKSERATLMKVQRTAMDRLYEGVAVFGLDGRLRLVNAAFLAMWNLGPEDLEGDLSFDDVAERCRPLFHKDSVWADMKARITDPSPEIRREAEGKLERSNRTLIKYLSRPLPDGATLLAFLDITAQERIEHALRERNEALEAADALKTEFVENVSYQLRNPLQTITGYAEVLNRFMAGPLNDRQREQIQMILQASESLSKLVDDVMDVALVEAGRLELDVKDVVVADLIADAVNMASTKATDSQVQLSVEIDPGIGVIRADGTRLTQALVNLLSNALRFTEPGGKITVGARDQGDAIGLFVADTGAGIDPAKQAEVFNHFTSGDRRGAGLGLALVRSFVELHQGWVALESVPGKGSTVTCHIPLTQRAKAAA